MAPTDGSSTPINSDARFVVTQSPSSSTTGMFALFVAMSLIYLSFYCPAYLTGSGVSLSGGSLVWQLVVRNCVELPIVTIPEGFDLFLTRYRDKVVASVLTTCYCYVLLHRSAIVFGMKGYEHFLFLGTFFNVVELHDVGFHYCLLWL